MELVEIYGLIAMNGLERSRRSLARQAMRRGLAAAEALSAALAAAKEEEEAAAGICRAAAAARKGAAGWGKAREEAVFSRLEAGGVMKLAPSLMSSDMVFETAGVEITVWRAEQGAYDRAVEELRAELLEPGEPTWDCAALFWLLRESCMLSELFSVKEQELLRGRVTALAAGSVLWRCIVECDFKNALVAWGIKAIRAKRAMFRNPYLEGVTLLFPFLERRASIFIDLVVLGSTVQGRREAVAAYLRGRGHRVEEIPSGTETLLEIDGSFYRVWPTTRVVRLPIQGVSLIPVYH